MKKLYLIRHAKSSWDNPQLRDIDRPLNPRGLRDAPFMANLLKEKTNGALDAIFSSPANRARSTADYFAKTFGLNLQIEENIYEAWEVDILDLIKTFDNNHNHIAIFGHNPTFTSLANRFSSEAIDNVPTCGIIKIESSAQTWQELSFLNSGVAAFYFPKQYF